MIQKVITVIVTITMIKVLVMIRVIKVMMKLYSTHSSILKLAFYNYE